MKVKSLTLPIILTILAGCGDGSQSSSGDEATLDPTSSVEVPGIIADNSVTETMSIAEEALLPACELENTNQLIYIETSEEFKKCSFDKWIEVKVKGQETLVTTVDALVTECANGGKIILTGKDLNEDGKLDITEAITKDPICNGVAGAKGDQGLTGATGADAENYSAKAFDLYTKYKRSIFYLKIQFVGGAINYATGFLCREQYICTSAHVLTSDQRVEFIDVSHIYEYLDTLTYSPLFRIDDPVPTVNTAKDLAAIHIGHRTAMAGLLSLPIESEYYSVDTLTPTFVMSYVKGMADLFSDIGNVLSDYVGTCYDASWSCLGNKYDFTTSNDTDSGSSGAPVFDISTGKVVGVVVAGPTAGTTSANWTWVNYVEDFNNL